MTFVVCERDLWRKEEEICSGSFLCYVYGGRIGGIERTAVGLIGGWGGWYRGVGFHVDFSQGDAINLSPCI